MSLVAVKHIVATLFSAQNALRELAPSYKGLAWATSWETTASWYA